MSMLKYIIFSSLEYLSLFMFILIQFRFSLKENITQILLISLLLSFVSYSFWSADLNGIFPLIQFVIVLLYMQIVMKVSLFNALIMFFTGYIVLGVVQTCFVALTMHLDPLHKELKAGTNGAYLMQLISSSMMMIFSFLVSYLKGGFSFIEAKSRFSRKTFTGKNRFSIGFILLAFLITIVSNILLLEHETPPYLAIAFILMLVLLSLFYLSLRRDERVD